MYKIIAIMGEAGSGKDTLLKSVLAENPNLHGIVSFTTRPPREGEVDGVDYHFVSSESFTEKILDDSMLEATFFNNWCYGTAIESLDKDKINIGVFNPNGVDSLIAHGNIYSVAYYTKVSDKERLLRQLNRETNPDIDEIIRRYQADKVDFADLDFHYNEIKNENKEDLAKNVRIISAAAKYLKDKKD